MSDSGPKWRVPRRRFARALKAIGVSLALVFFALLITLLWAFETGKAVEVTKDRLTRELKTSCSVDMELDSLKLSLFPPTVHLGRAGFWSADKEELLSVDEAHVRLAVLPLLYGKVQLDRVVLVRPHASIDVADGRIASLPPCLRPTAAADSEPGPPAAPIALGVGDLEVRDARVRFSVAGSLEGDLDGIEVRLKPGSAGGSELSVALKGGSLEVLGHAVPLHASRLKAHLAGALTRPRAISISELSLAARHTQLVASGSVDLLGPVYEAKLKLSGPLADGADFLSDTSTVTGKLELSASVSGTLASPHAVGSLIVEGGQVAKKKLADRVEAEFRVSPEELVVSRLELALADGRVRGSVRLDLSEERLPIKADLAPDHISFARIADCLDILGVWADFKGTGKITAQGSLRPLKLGGAVDVALDKLTVYDGAWDRPELRPGDDTHVMLAMGPATVDGTWSADPDGFWIREAKLTHGTSTGTATARISFEDKNGLYLVADLAPFDIAELGPIAHAHFGGAGRLAATIVGPYWDMRGKGQLEMAGVKVEGIPFGNVKSVITWRDTTVTLEDVSAVLEKSAYVGDLTVELAPSLSLSAVGKVTAGRLEDLLVPFAASADDWGHPSAKMTAEFDLRGHPTHLTGPITADLEDVVIVDEHAERARVEGHIDQGVLAFEAVEVHKHGAVLIGTARLDPKAGEIVGHLRTRGLRLAHIDALASLPALDGAGAISLDVEGRLGALSGTVTATLDEILARGKDFGGGTLVGHIRGKSMLVLGKVFGGALAVDAKIGVERGLPYSAELKLEGGDVPDLVARLGSGAPWTGTASGRAELSGRLVDWRDSSGSIFLDHGRFQNGGAIDLELVGAARLGLDHRVIETKRLSLSGPNTKLTVSGQAGAELLDLKIQGKFDLAVLSTLFAPVERSAGTLAVNAIVRLKGTDLDLLGTGKVERGSLQWRNFPSRLSNVEANLSFSQATVLIERAEGRYAEGAVRATGQVTLDGFRPGVVAIEAELDAVRPLWSYAKFDLASTLSGHLSLEGRPDSLLLRGDLTAARSLLRPKIDWRSVVSDPTKRIGAGVYEPSKEILQLDVKLHTDADDPVKLKNDTAEADLSGELALTGTNQRLGLLGGLSVGRGRVGFLGRDYTIEGGTLEFKERYAFAPYYDLALSARACDASISLNILGTMDDLSTSYASKPEMEETNIVSCLIRGVKIKDLENLRGDNRTNAAASFAGEALWRLSGVDREVRKVLPVDQIEVTTEFSRKEHVYEPRILVAKEIRDGQIRLEYSSSLLKNDDQRAAVRYRITPQLTLQYGWTSSEDMSIGDHGIDLKYRWEW